MSCALVAGPSLAAETAEEAGQPLPEVQKAAIPATGAAATGTAVSGPRWVEGMLLGLTTGLLVGGTYGKLHCTPVVGLTSYHNNTLCDIYVFVGAIGMAIPSMLVGSIIELMITWPRNRASVAPVTRKAAPQVLLLPGFSPREGASLQLRLQF